jgi:6-pyruvoyltetrahydropterin/6-carboxytetrahydropterin synthase
MPHVLVTRRVHFCAAHKLTRKEWTEEKNREVFGDCAHPNWHGHNYELDVTVEGEIDRETGYVLDLKRLQHVVRHSVIDDLDHRNLNLDVKWVEHTIPTTENLVVAIWDRIRPRLPEGIDLKRLVLRETPQNWAEYEGG